MQKCLIIAQYYDDLRVVIAVMAISLCERNQLLSESCRYPFN